MKRSTHTAAIAALALTTAFAPHAGAAKGNEVPPVPPALVSTKGVTDIATTFKLPGKSGRSGGPSPYKFEDLAAPTTNEQGETIHASFGVVGKTKKSMNSTVHAANKRHRTYLKNADGSPQMTTKKVKGQNVPVQAFTQDRQFEAFDVKEDGGVTVRIFRTK